MSQLPQTRSETCFDDFKAAYSPAQARDEANRCLYCANAPCISACPTEINVPEFIRKISTGNDKGAARTIFAANSLGMSCARVCPVEVLCGGACVLREAGLAPIQIGKLQRFATDMAYAKGWQSSAAGEATGKSVGLVGGGPASLAAAHRLRQQGHACTIYEKRDILGGLNTWGIAPYKIRADKALEEAAWVLEIGGIEVKTGVEIGRNLAFNELLKQHDALFVGFGLGPDSWLGVPGEDLQGVHGALDFIERMKLSQVATRDVQRAIVVGAGNTAVDAVRELLGLGVPEVTMVYRGAESVMKGYAHEWDVAKTGGARGEWQSLPVAFVGGSRVEQVRCVRVDGNKQPISDTEYTLAADLVLMALGQQTIGDQLAGVEGVEVVKGCIAVDDEGRTGRAGLFAGGDCTNGGKEVVHAVAEGKRAAAAIDAYLRGGGHA